MERIEREIASGRIPIALPVMYRRLPQRLLELTYERNESSSDGEWSEESSGTTEYCSSASSEAEWESSVDSNGELIFIDCHPVSLNQAKKCNNKEDITFPHNKSGRSTRGKLLRLIRRRESKRKRSLLVDVNKKGLNQVSNEHCSSSNKVTFRDCQEGEVKEVSLLVDPKNRLRFGRRATASEALLGLTLSSFSDGMRIMIAGFVPKGEAIKHRNIKIGDWLKTVNDREVNLKTIDSVLDRLKNPCLVKLKLQRIAGVEVTTEPPPNKIPKQSELVRQLVNPNVEDDNELAEILLTLPVGVLFLTTEGLSETGPEYQGVYYCYPGPLKKNALCSTRGAFMTLYHLLPEVLKSKVVSTTIILNGKLTHVIYINEGSEIMLVALPKNRCTLREAVLITKELETTLKFMYQTLNKCFLTESNLQHLNHFFSRFFARILCSGLWTDAPQCVEIHELAARADVQAPAQFEYVLQTAHHVPLPLDVQIDINDCLNDMEACDYREWNEDPMDCQRLYTIIGSCLFHSGYLLMSHFQKCDLIDVHSFCRQQGLLHLFQTESVRSFVLWREVFPSSCHHGLTNKPLVSNGYRLPHGRWFLLIVGYDKDMLAVIFEAGGCTVSAEGKLGPDPFYVEEVQDTLEEIQYLGVMEVAKRWIANNINPQVVLPELEIKNLKRSDFLAGSIGLSKSEAIASISKQSFSSIAKKPEVTSILKRRNSQDNLGSVSQLSHNSSSTLYPLPGDVLDESGSFKSLNSDEQQPVMGRREARERGVTLLDNYSESGSDGSRCLSNSENSFDLSDMRQALLSDLENMVPSKITVGEENCLFHYVKLDKMEGVMLCPTVNENQNERYVTMLNNFRRCSQIIHKLFERTLKYKTLLNYNSVGRAPINKSLVAIKEHAVLFEYAPSEENKKSENLKYWVTGRLFSDPHPRELYVCYNESVPQNMVEIAFRLGVISAG